MDNLRIISGGQTGVDRGALDAALASGAGCGGWCPKGRRAEDGAIPRRYPLAETRSPDYRVRTRRNIADSDATLVIHDGRLEGGTALTVELCRSLGRPCLVVDAAAEDPDGAAERVRNEIRGRGVRVLNVAGPRASKWPEAAATARRLVERLLREPA